MFRMIVRLNDASAFAVVEQAGTDEVRRPGAPYPRSPASGESQAR